MKFISNKREKKERGGGKGEGNENSDIHEQIIDICIYGVLE